MTDIDELEKTVYALLNGAWRLNQIALRLVELRSQLDKLEATLREAAAAP